MKKAIVEMSDLELVQRFLHRDLILFISRGKDDLEEFKKRNQRFINSMHFTYAQLESCYEEAKETLGLITKAKNLATKEARTKVLKDLMRMKEH